MTAAVDRVADVRPAGQSSWLARVDLGRLFTHLSLLFLVIVLMIFSPTGLLGLADRLTRPQSKPVGGTVDPVAAEKEAVS